ncbi:MAG: purine-cytosine permease family protein [Ostreibacterium sp.]
MAGIISTIKKQNNDPDFSTSTVPQYARMSKVSLTMAWWALCSAMIWLLISAALAMDYGTKNAITGLVLSVLTYGIINSVISKYAIKTGLSVGLFSRKVYGNVGELLATGIFATIAIYYCVFEGSVIAVAIQHYFSKLELWHAYLIVVLYSVPLVFGGVGQWLDKLNGVLLPFYYIGLFAAVALAVNQYGYTEQWLDMGPPGAQLDSGWWSCYSYFMGLWVMMMYTWDYARFGKKEDTKYHSSFNFGIPFYLCTYLLNGVIGIYLVASIPSEVALSEISVVLAILKLMGFMGLVFIWISQTRINTANFQLAAVNLQSFLYRILKVKLSKITMAILVGVLVFLLMLTNVFSFILQALAYQSIFVVSWVVIALTYIFIHRKEVHDENKGNASLEQQNVKICGVVAWASSSLVGVIMLNTSGDFSQYASLTTIIVAVTVYSILQSIVLKSEKN